MKHTPRPWHQGGIAKEEMMSPSVIFAADGAAVAQFYGIPLHKTLAEVDKLRHAEGLGNIETVLRAVNSFDDILAALKSLVNLTDQGREGGLILSRVDGKPLTNGDQVVIDRAYITADAARAKAEGKP
jgi:hypothetical protein